MKFKRKYTKKQKPPKFYMADQHGNPVEISLRVDQRFDMNIRGYRKTVQYIGYNKSDLLVKDGSRIERLPIDSEGNFHLSIYQDSMQQQVN